jgi:hypothetical protein
VLAFAGYGSALCPISPFSKAHDIADREYWKVCTPSHNSALSGTVAIAMTYADRGWLPHGFGIGRINAKGPG